MDEVTQVSFCAWCEGFWHLPGEPWQPVQVIVEEPFVYTHGICETCEDRVYRENGIGKYKAA